MTDWKGTLKIGLVVFLVWKLRAVFMVIFLVVGLEWAYSSCTGGQSILGGRSEFATTEAPKPILPQELPKSPEEKYQLARKIESSFDLDFAKRDELAFKTYLAAAEEGHPRAMSEVAYAYISIVGVRRHKEDRREKALYWLNKATDKEDPLAINTLADWKNICQVYELCP